MEADKVLFQEKSPEDRLANLESLADSVIEDTYYHTLSLDEITEKRALLTDDVIEHSDLEQQKKEVVADYKKKMDPLKSNIGLLSKEVKTGIEERYGKMYKFLDEHNSFVHFYDERGILIENRSRPARQEELQKTIFMDIKTGTDD